MTATLNDDDTLTLGASVVGGPKGTEIVTDGIDAASGTVEVRVANVGVKLAMTGAAGVGNGGAVVVALGLGWYLVRRRKHTNED